MKYLKSYQVFEGLIKSYSIKDLIKALVRFAHKHKILGKIEPDSTNSFYFICTISDFLEDPKVYKEFFNIIKICGWYIPGVNHNEQTEYIEYNEDKLESIFDYLGKEYGYSYKLFFHVVPKFGEKVNYNKEFGTQENLYHITSYRYLERIKKRGLIPKSKIKRSKNPERIYLATLWGIKKIKGVYLQYVDDPVVLSIPIKTLKENNIQLFKDPDADNAYYTHDNINPKWIEVKDDEFFSQLKDLNLEIEDLYNMFSRAISLNAS